MTDSEDDRLEEIRQKKLEELRQRKQAQQEEQEARREAAEQQKQAVLRQHLTDDARQRLNTVKMSKPEFAEQVEQQLVALAQSGRINGKIDDEKMKELLSELKPDSPDFNIRRR